MSDISRFLSYLEAELLRSRHTVDAYRRDLGQYAAASGAGDDLPVSAIEGESVRRWLGELAEKGESAASLRRKLQTLRAFIRWGMKTGRIGADPLERINLPKLRKKLPDFVKTSEMEELLNDSDSSFAGRRRHIVLLMLYSLGLRQDELLRLTDADIDRYKGEARINGKRNKQRIVPLPAPLLDEIREWQKLRDEQYPDLRRPAPLLAGPHGVLSKESLYRIVREALTPVSAGRKSPHTLRHTFATAMLNDGADLDAVREMLGHSSLATTQIYTHLSINELLGNYKGSHPRTREDKNKIPE